MAIFGPKPWVNPFGKMSVFWTFETCCFYSLQRRFFVLEYLKRIFPGPYSEKKKKFEKRPFLDQNDGLTPSEKSQFFDFLNFLFLSPRKAFLSVLECRRIHFPGLYCVKKKSFKNGHFWTKTIG